MAAKLVSFVACLLLLLAVVTRAASMPGIPLQHTFPAAADYANSGYSAVRAVDTASVTERGGTGPITTTFFPGDHSKETCDNEKKTTEVSRPESLSRHTTSEATAALKHEATAYSSGLETTGPFHPDSSGPRSTRRGEFYEEDMKTTAGKKVVPLQERAAVVNAETGDDERETFAPYQDPNYVYGSGNN